MTKSQPKHCITFKTKINKCFKEINMHFKRAVSQAIQVFVTFLNGQFQGPYELRGQPQHKTLSYHNTGLGQQHWPCDITGFYLDIEYIGYVAVYNLESEIIHVHSKLCNSFIVKFAQKLNMQSVSVQIPNHITEVTEFDC